MALLIVAAWIGAFPSNAEDALAISTDDLEAGAIELTGWLYRPGDHPGPANAEAGSWRALEHTAFEPGQSFPQWPGIGWFRLPLDIPAELVGRAVALRLDHPGASEVFLDGERVAQFGEVAAFSHLEDPYDPHGVPISLVVSEPGRHELELRYSCTAAAGPGLGPWLTVARGAGFKAVLDLPERALEEIVEKRTAYLGLNLGISALALGFAILHGLIFIFHPRQPGNLWFSLFAVGLVANGGFETLLRWGHLGLWGITVTRFCNSLAALGLIVALVLFLGSLRSRPAVREARWLAVGFTAVLLSSHVPELITYRPLAVALWFLAVLWVLVWVGLGAWRHQIAHARLFAIATLGCVVLVASEIAKQSGLLSLMAEVSGFSLGILLILTGASLFLAHRIAQEERELESLARDLEGRVAERTEELRRSEKAALAASEAKTSFLATMSHEIRTPMNAIVGLAELLADSRLSTAERRMAATLQRSAVALLHLIDEVLDLSRIEAGRLELEQRPFRLEPVVGESIDLFRTQASRDGIELTCRVASGVPESVVGDPARLRQILVNLIGNALKFTAEGRVDVLVEQREDALAIEVADTGMGIPEAVRARLFEPFYQADGSTTRRHGGAGLGLAICHRLVAAMGGRLEVESELGQGSTFRVSLPLAETSEDVEEAQEPAPVDQDDEISPLRILLAEDHPINQMVTKLMFLRLGQTIDVVDRGSAALAALSKTTYDVVFLDLHMPEMDGIEVARRIRSWHGSEPYLIALTASVLPEDRERCRAVGMNDFLAKPVQLDALRGALRRAWEVIEEPASTTGPA